VRTLKVVDGRTGSVLASSAGLCDSSISRFRGLMLRPSLNEGDGIVLTPCGSVHMALMRFAIDVLYLDRGCRAAKLVSDLQPYRVSFGGRRAHAAVELPAGTLARLGVLQGDEILLEDESGSRVSF
jgi:uncharacterized membrane protein (UPF0127 family)